MARSLGSQTLNPQFAGPLAERFLARYYGQRAPEQDEQLAFYRLLDEFF